MGAIADGFVAFAQPLLDQTDGSMEELNKALAVGQLCFNLAILPEDGREEMLSKMRRDLNMDDEEFEAFRRDLIGPMIRRHEQMFPRMHRPDSAGPLQFEPAMHVDARTTASAKRPAVIDRYAPCPCNSGKKYKFCCGAKGR